MKFQEYYCNNKIKLIFAIIFYVLICIAIGVGLILYYLSFLANTYNYKKYDWNYCDSLNEISDVGLGTTDVFDEFWKNRIISVIGTTNSHFPSSYGMINSEYSLLYQKLVEEIRKLHEKMGIVETEGKEIVLGAGSTQLLRAAFNVQFNNNPFTNEEEAKLYTQTPYFMFSENLLQNSGLFNKEVLFITDKNELNNKWIEYINSPNNPTGLFNYPTTNASYYIYDRAYYWPHFLGKDQYNEIELTQEQKNKVIVETFTMSKMVGLASLRIGWALVSNKTIADQMKNYIFSDSLGISSASVSDAISIFQYLNNKHNYRSFFYKWAIPKFTARWEELSNSIELNNYLYLSNSKGAYGVITHNNNTTNLYNYFLQNCSLKTQDGLLFGLNQNQVRINMMLGEKCWNNLLSCIKKNLE
jgi:aspartate/methionine/tyrosine aminotransferase